MIGNWKKEDSYHVVEDAASLALMWKVENVPNEQALGLRTISPDC